MSAGEAVPHPRLSFDLLGHEAAERVLLDAWNSGRIPHAWLIGGVAGIGKATLAYRFARFVLAQGAEEGGAAGLFGEAPRPRSLEVPAGHPVSARVASGGHGNLLVVERVYDEKRKRVRQEILVDDARRIGPFLRQTASEGGWRVVIVDGADTMNASSQNAILKLLEEPPSRSLLLLTADNPGSLLPTIRSRCRKLRLDPLNEAVVEHLVARHRPDLPEAERAALCRLAEGSVGRALALAEAGGLKLYREIVDLIAAMPGLDTAKAHAFADKLSRRGADDAYETAAELLVWWLGRLVQQAARGVAFAETVPGEGALVARLAALPRGLDRWMDVWEKVARLFTRADNANLDRKQVVLTALGTIEAATA